MNQRLRTGVLLSTVMLVSAASLPAQEERALFDLLRQSRAQFEEMAALLKQRQSRVNRLLVVITQLTRDNDGLKWDGPATGRARVQEGIDKARETAAEEPSLDDEVFSILDLCQAELDKNVIGETREAFAARFLDAARPLEDKAMGELSGWLMEAHGLKELRDIADDLTMKAFGDSSRQMQRLLSLRSRTQPARPPG